ncbi:MAG: transglycosylase domain-containing protein [Clostridia bacterium]|nr:transglycosylase domain-containing protein [Clostridia bacterium]
MKKGWIVWVSLVSVLSALVLAFGLFSEQRFLSDTKEELLMEAISPQSPRFFAYEFSNRQSREGERIEVTSSVYRQKSRIYTKYEELPEDLIHAFVAIEDKRYWEHGGVDWKRTAGAIFNYLFWDEEQYGGSTITQQLVKNVTGNREKSVSRKFGEVLLALRWDAEYGKERILEYYLNVISFSDNCIGIAAAVERYFGKKPSELSLEECASLAALVNSPTYYHPERHPREHLERRNLVLKEMFLQGYLDERTYETAVSSPLSVLAGDGYDGVNSWYLETVYHDVVKDLTERYGMSEEEASHLYDTGGLSIDLAMDPALQKIAEEYYQNELKMPINASGESAQSAILVIDPKTGDLLASVGGVGQKAGNRVQDFATEARRSPGSTIKPLSLYGPALETGIITWASVYDDVPTEFGKDGITPWPNNATRVYRGLTDIFYAVAHSTNTVAVRVLRDLGTETAYRYALENFHLTGLEGNDKNASVLALGQLETGVTLRELCAAYTVFADGGNYHTAKSYFRVTDSNGKVLLSNPTTSERVLSSGNAAIMTKLLEGVVKEGTSSSVTLRSITECAGKTGSTSNDCDRWFVGYTPELLCGVWCGYAYPEPLSGKNLATGIWNEVMTRMTLSVGGKKNFATPETLVLAAYCKDSGNCYTEVCEKDPRGDRKAYGWFVRGTEPKEACSTHVLCRMHPDGGILEKTSEEEKSLEVALIRVSRRFPIPVFVTDAQYCYGGDPYLFEANEDETLAYFDKEGKYYFGKSAVEKPFNRSYLPPVVLPDWEYLEPLLERQRE